MGAYAIGAACPTSRFASAYGTAESACVLNCVGAERANIAWEEREARTRNDPATSGLEHTVYGHTTADCGKKWHQSAWECGAVLVRTGRRTKEDGRREADNEMSGDNREEGGRAAVRRQQQCRKARVATACAAHAW
ncbi:hypothetical protein ERJ75_000517600 [Trypanosoma vivax]|nr:hypothetical protein ERJ75_000517600 [Trypanosoma vivax]